MKEIHTKADYGTRIPTVLRKTILSRLSRSTIKRNFSEVDLAYLAGLIDGEGSIYAGLGKHKHASGYKYYFDTHVAISNNSLNLMRWLTEKVGGNFSLVHKIGEGEVVVRKHEGYRWYVSKIMDVKEILEQLLPYLVIKQEEAKKALDAINTYLKINYPELNVENGGIHIAHTQKVF
jgi:intein-encoded DNA endonuclease-like protein